LSSEDDSSLATFPGILIGTEFHTYSYVQTNHCISPRIAGLLPLVAVVLGPKKVEIWPAGGEATLSEPLRLVEMKKIEAIISPTKFEAVREGLNAAGIVGRLIVTTVCGLQRPSTLSAPGPESNKNLVRSIKVEVIVSDQLARKAVNAIFDYMCSEKEDHAVGQITVLDIETTLPIGAE
jgi:nitrogen regulatory protein PII